MATSCFSGLFYSFDAVGLTWSIDRFFFLGLVLAYFVQRWRRNTDPKPLMRVEYVLGVFVVMLLVSTFTHDWRASSAEIPVLMHLVNGYFIPLTIYWIARQSVLTQRGVRVIYIVLALFGIYLATTAILEITGQWAFVFPRYIADSEIGLHWGRARGPYLQAATFGMFMVVCMLACWAAWTSTWRALCSNWWMVVTLIPLYAVGIAVTWTRSAWAGCAAAIALLATCLLRGRWRYAFVTLLSVSILALVFTQGRSLVAFKRETSAQITKKSTYSRLAFAYVSWLMIKERPWTGFGFGQFPNESGAYLNDRATKIYLEEIRGYIHHNTPLCVLVELGIIGFVVFFTILAMWVDSNWRLWRDSNAPEWMRRHALFVLGALSAYSFQLMFRDVTYTPVENSVIFLLVGITSGLTAARTRESLAENLVEQRPRAFVSAQPGF